MEIKVDSPVTEQNLIDIAEELSTIKSSLVDIVDELEGSEAIGPIDDALEAVEDAIDAIYEAVDLVEEEEYELDEEAEEEDEAEIEGEVVVDRTVSFGNKEINLVVKKGKK